MPPILLPPLPRCVWPQRRYEPPHFIRAVATYKNYVEDSQKTSTKKRERNEAARRLYQAENELLIELRSKGIKWKDVMSIMEARFAKRYRQSTLGMRLNRMRGGT